MGQPRFVISMGWGKREVFQSGHHQQTGAAFYRAWLEVQTIFRADATRSSAVESTDVEEKPEHKLKHHRHLGCQRTGASWVDCGLKS